MPTPLVWVDLARCVPLALLASLVANAYHHNYNNLVMLSLMSITLASVMLSLMVSVVFGLEVGVILSVVGSVVGSMVVSMMVGVMVGVVGGVTFIITYALSIGAWYLVAAAPLLVVIYAAIPTLWGRLTYAQPEQGELAT
jgi:hypothetical protein